MKIINNKIFFYSNYFSNFHRCKFEDPNTGLIFPTTEHAFMWFKARFFSDESSMKKLETMFDSHPYDAKNIGRKVSNYDDKSWDCVRVGYMVYVNYLKYSQNPDLKQKLLDSGDKILVEASPNDVIWGIGLAEGEPNEFLDNEANWKGQNLLGKSLMRVRNLIK